jgi:futalosine hydrolase
VGSPAATVFLPAAFRGGSVRPCETGGAHLAIVWEWRTLVNTLILIPTDRERQQLAEPLAPSLRAGDRIELCGFGPVVAAARAAELLVKQKPERVLLVGIAGAYSASLDLGSASAFGEVGCYGVGAGEAAGFLTAGQMGWLQWPGEENFGPHGAIDADADAEKQAPPCAVGDTLRCPIVGSAPAADGLLLTVCAAAATADDVANRLQLFPTAVAEDMEGFAVAVACRMAGVPCGIVRGISNRAGDRHVAGWQIGPALTAAAGLVCGILEERP